MNKKLKGKTIAVTGCTGGLGRELCFYLAGLGADIVMVDRNPHKSQLLAEEIKHRHTKVKITSITADMEDMESVKCTVRQLCAVKPDCFIANAGAYNIPRHICDTGYDNIFQINFVSPYYMARKLYENDEKIKIVAVGSVAHRYSKTDGKDIGFRTRKGCAKAYGNSKRFLMLALHEYFKDKCDNLSVVHPGITVTGITDHYPGIIYSIIKTPMKIIFPPPKMAMLNIADGVFRATPHGRWIGPTVFDIWGKPCIKRLKICFSEESKAVGDAAEEIYRRISK